MVTVAQFIDSIERLEAGSKVTLKSHVQTTAFGTSLDAECDDLVKETLQADLPASFSAMDRTAVTRTLRRLDLRTRSELLESILPAPVMSTTPSGQDQAEAARPNHPESVQAFDVAPIVLAYLASLPATPNLFTLPDSVNLTLATREAAANIWDAGVLEPANRLRNFQTYSREAGNQAGSSARWQAQSNTTETHSELSDLGSTAAVQSAARVAQELVEQTTHVRHSWTFDYLLKTSASRIDRCLSVVKLKHLERLSLRGRAQPVDWDRPPNIPDIWSRRCDGVSAMLQSNVDSVIAQVDAYTAAHGIQYGMISNILWRWAFVMDGKNHMQISQPFRFNATGPTVLQVHSWVTDMSLKSKALQSWATLKQHPGAAASVTAPQHLHRRSHAVSNLGVTPAISKSAHSKPAGRIAGSSIPKNHSTSVGLSANPSPSVPGVASALGGCMCPEAATLQAASLFSIESVQAVLAVGTSGPVFNARSSSGEAMALKVASLGSWKHHDLKHQENCLMALRSLWGQCVPHIVLAGELRAHGHGYGLGTMLVHGRHPKPDISLLMLFQTVPSQACYC